MKFAKFFLTLYLVIGFTPNLGASDVNSTQVFYLSILNFVTLFYLLVNNQRRKTFLQSIGTNYYFIFLLLFFLWSLITSPFAINQNESIRVIAEFAPLFIATLPINYFLHSTLKINTRWIINIIPILVGLEIATVIIPYFNDIIEGLVISRSAKYSGVTGNINIAAFSIVMKLPFVWFHLFNKKANFYIRVVSFFIYTAGLYSVISIHETRGAILSVFVLIIGSFSYLIIKKIHDKKPLLILKNGLILLLPLFFVISLDYFQGFENQQTNLFDRMETLQTLEDGSSQERLRFYGQAVSSIMNKPFLGVGIGNWALEAIVRDIDYISNYVVAYHVHNDFLEIFAETGILGFLFFFGPIFLAVYILIRIIFLKKFDDSADIYFFILLSITGYLFDSFLNFPFSRPIQVMHLLFCVLFVNGFQNSRNLLKIKPLSNIFIKPIIILIIVLIPLNIYAAERIYKSNVEQYVLFGQFNSNNFVEPIENILKYEDEFPELSGTTIPLSTFKGIFLVNNDKFEEAIPYFRKGLKQNPHLPISEAYLGWSHYNLNKIDSALYYNKKAFDILPNNAVHYAYYMIALSAKKDSTLITETYNKMKEISSQEYVENVYLVALSGVLGKTESQELISNANKRLLETKDPNAIRGIYVLNFGEERTSNGHKAHELGIQFFEQGQYENAAKFFEQATKFNDLEAPYFENAGNAYMKIGNYQKALYFFDHVLDNLNSSSSKANYLKALIMLDLKTDNKQACDLLLVANKNGHPEAMRVYKYYCK